jgi:RHS repeat-associated protein
VNATNGLICYHADATANIIALTDGNTNLVAQFAYTPYGRSLGSTNSQGQLADPYLFVGSQGVVEEVPGLYFMRARYYSADAGVFFSTDPVKKIGPGWKPVSYEYVNGNPLGSTDPSGESPLLVAFKIYGFLNDATKLAMGETTMADLAKKKTEDRIALSGIYGVNAEVGEILVSSKGIFDDARKGEGLPAAIGNAYLGLVYAAGNALGNVLYNNFGVGSSGSTVLSSPTAGTTPMAVLPASSRQLQPAALSIGGIGSGSASSSQSMSSRAAGAGSYAQSVTAQTQTRSAPSSSGSGATTQSVSGGGSSSGSGGSAIGGVVNSVSSWVSSTSQSISQAVQSASRTVSQAISTAVSSVGSWFSGLFGGHH